MTRTLQDSATVTQDLSVAGIVKLDTVTPVATVSTVGTVKPGAGLSIAGDGTLSTSVTLGTSPIYYLRDYGVVADGSTDDTAALNAAFALAMGSSTGATFILDGVCKTSDTITIGATTGDSATAPASFISLICTGGAASSPIRYYGPNDGREAVRFAKNKSFYVRGLGVLNKGSQAGTGIILAGVVGSSNSTNVTNGAIFDDCLVENFGFGITDDASGACSEIQWNSLSIANCFDGWTVTGFNSLNHVFVLLKASSCSYVLDSGATSFNVFGGSTTGSLITDFYIGQNAVCGIYNLRSEDGNCFLQGTNGGAGSVVVKNCSVTNPKISGTPAIGAVSVSGNFTRLAIEDCYIKGWIAPATVQDISITNSLVPVDANSNLPFAGLATYDPGTFTHVKTRNNIDINNSWNRASDIDCVVTAAAETYSPTYLTNVKRVMQAGNGLRDGGVDIQTLGADYLGLHHVRCLSEGPAGTPATPAAAQTLTTSASTAIGSNVLTVSSVPSWMAIGLIATDSTHGSAVNGSVVTGFTSTTILLSDNVASPGVSSGDTISFTDPYGNQTPGNNLRVTGTFATSATLNFTFTRSITAHSNGYAGTDLFAEASYVFYLSDVGKPISAAGQGNSGWTNWYGYIVEYVSSTHVRIQQAGGQNPPNFTNGTTVVIGQNEPDANYIVVSAVGNAATPEQYSVTAQTSSGFTAQSSNASSTATVSFLIVR